MLHIVSDRDAVATYCEGGEAALTWSDFQSRLLALDPRIAVASRSLEELVLEPILGSFLPEKLATLAANDVARRRWMETARGSIHGYLDGRSSDGISWIEAGAESFVKRLDDLGFVPRGGLSRHLTHLVNHIDYNRLSESIGSASLHAAPDLAWSPNDLALWSALKRRLEGVGNVSASIYALDLPLEATGSESPFDRFADLYCKLTGEPAASALVTSYFGDLTLGDYRKPHEAIAIIRATTRQAWRESIVNCVHDALGRGVAPEAIAVVYANQESAQQAALLLEGEGLPVCTRGQKEASVLLHRVHTVLEMASAAVQPPDPSELSEIAALRSSGSPNEHAARIQVAMRAIGSGPSIPRASTKPGHPWILRNHLRALAREESASLLLDNVLTEVTQAFFTISESDVSFDTFANVVRSSLPRDVSVSVGSRIGAIQIVPIYAARGAKVVIVIDTCRDEFPPSPNRATLGTSKETQTLDEATQWASVARAFESIESVTLVFSMQNGDGSAAEPSRALRWLEHNDARSRTATASSRELLPQSDRRLSKERARVRSFFGVNRLGPAHDPAEWQRQVSAATGAYAHAPMRVTLLEPILDCGFAGFANAVLRAKRDDKSPFDPHPRELGRLRHAALEAAFTATHHLWNERPRADANIVALGVAAAAGLLRREMSLDATVMIDRIAMECENVLSQSVNDLDWDFFSAEQAFDGQTWPTYVLAREEGDVHLSGRIDRIDRSHVGKRFRVVDYKSGTTNANDARSKPLQLLVYAAVCKRELQPDQTEGFYWPVRARSRVDKRSIPLEDHALLHEAIEATLALRRYLPLANGAPTTCDKCSYDIACRKPRYVVSGLLDDSSES